jgi:hypothetical protein
VVLALTLAPLWLLAGLVPALLLAAFDLVWIDRRVTDCNKALRMRLFLKPGARPPQGYRGRFTDDEQGLEDYVRLKESERAGHQPTGSDASESGRRHTPSFNEQEAMLRELAKDEQGEGA